ncbi:FAD/NAD(P)-binding domain-containing protein [Paraphaeosphaeria sporulosa]|uniref:FAD/NAD(P)-binding domain-containing protein n=1 Tax=Paraphaeosphaeria sporulosa TaxID=1460663 RepID=A0A177BX44_9PLEO|nr:FAD/NAD(P)-binding domain-containing protein [Paraphaeosphaeria sporulosa]OAF99261.1 FAD/NAD(P)-binding domain-containing protein [Paraphaeosphaeria sporulosa]
MVEVRNIVVVGASSSGLQVAHYIAKYLLPVLKNKDRSVKYHLYIINPSSDWFFRIASPRVATSTSLISTEKVFVPLADVFGKYSKDEVTWIQAAATGLNHSARLVEYKRVGEKEEEHLQYHALIVATGSRTYYPAFSTWSDKETTLEALKYTETAAAAAKSIIIAGGGATGVEAAGELGDFLNGRPGWFSTPQRKVAITLLTSAQQLLPTVRKAIGDEAERKLKGLGVDVRYNIRVTDARKEQDGKTTLTLSNGETITTDLYIPAHGVQPNSQWLPPDLLTENKYLNTNARTLRVDLAGPRVYAIGDVSSYSRNTVIDIMDGLPVLVINLKRDLLAYDAKHPERATPGKDRVFKPNTKETMVVPIGTATGVGVLFGFRVPGFLVWLLKGRDYFIGMSMMGTATGSKVNEVKWTKEEEVSL